MQNVKIIVFLKNKLKFIIKPRHVFLKIYIFDMKNNPQIYLISFLLFSWKYTEEKNNHEACMFSMFNIFISPKIQADQNYNRLNDDDAIKK